MKRIVTDRPTAKERLSHCMACPKLNKMGICGMCGCIMPAKVWLKNATCPESKW